MCACKPLIALGVVAGLALAALAGAAGTSSSGVYERALALQDQGWSPEFTTRLLALAFDAGLEGAAAADLLGRVHALTAQGFPPAGIRARMEEGLAKRIPAARIVAALYTRLDHGLFVMGLPQVAAGGPTGPDAEALVMLADSLELGLTAPELERLAAAGGSLSQVAVAAEMTAMLRQMGFDPALGQRIVQTGMGAGALNREWRSLPQIAALARRRGLSDGEVTQAVLERLEAGASPRDLLPALGFTGRDLRRGPMTP